MRKNRQPQANNESSEVCGIIKPGQRIKLNRSQAVNVHKLLTIRYLPTAGCALCTLCTLHTQLICCGAVYPRPPHNYTKSVLSTRALHADAQYGDSLRLRIAIANCLCSLHTIDIGSTSSRHCLSRGRTEVLVCS